MDDVETMRQFVQERRRGKRAAAARRRAAYEHALPQLVQGILMVDPDVELVMLFGSLARPDDANVGDVDIAIRSQRFLMVAGWLLRQEIPLDVVDIDDVHDHIRERILTEGRVLYERN